jgi:miniconductance mechanosensitive channel
MYSLLRDFLVSLKLSAALAGIVASCAIFLALFLTSVIVYLISAKILIAIIGKIVKRTKSNWDDILLRHKVFKRLAGLIPALLLLATCRFAFPPDAVIVAVIIRLISAYMIVIVVTVLDALLGAVDHIYRKFEVAKTKPITGYLQVVKIFLFITGFGLVITTLLNKSPLAFLSGIGALSAVILLVFKDSIMGFVAGIQLTANDLVRIGDWIEMPQFGADGDVIDVTLQSIKVQNFDKTITTIPIYSLVSGSFRNWRGMSESGGRRIKRAISIDMNSIKFCTEEMLENFGKIKYIAGYLKKKADDLGKYNTQFENDNAFLVNGRHLTNIGTFRAYVEGYLRNHPFVSKDMTLLIRQLPPGPEGLPIEIYVFCTDKVWANYEKVQADIFDHILAVVPLFGLRVFQKPSGADIKALAANS